MKKIRNILFAKDINIKVRIFNLLALTGIAVSIIILLASIIHGTSFINCVALLFTSVSATILLIYSVKKQRYMRCYLMTIILVFIILFPILFFTAGGYHSGMPCFFVFAFVFTIFMLEGKLGIILTAIEMLLYLTCCIIAYLYPQGVMAYPDERGVLTDVVISFLVSGSALGAALFFLIRMYNNQQRMLEVATLQAESSNRAKSKFLSQMSHEIRTPINAILGMNELILRGATKEEIQEYALNIDSAGNTLLSLVNDILDFSKIESEKMEINPVEYDLSSLLHDILQMISEKAKKKNLELEFNVSKEIPFRLYGDSLRIKQIITNLLTNAIKYTESGSIILTVNSTRCDDRMAMLHVSVQDTGIGIKKEDKELLREPFQRVDLSRNYNIEGTGLGLSITVNLLELMDSSLQIESEYGLGSKFSFDVKQGVVEDVPIGDFAGRIESGKKNRNIQYEGIYVPGGRVLVVDDNRMNLTVIKGLLKNTGLVVDTVLSGQEAIASVSREYYHIIFMDYMMPGMDGVETLEKMRSMSDNKCKDSKVIMLTANAVSGAKEMFLEKGFDGFLSKPIKPQKLEEAILRFLPDDMRIEWEEKQGTNPEKVSKEKQKMIQEEDCEVKESQSMPPVQSVQTNQTATQNYEEAEATEQIQKKGLSVLREKLPQVNFEKGVGNCGGDEAFYLELFRDFTQLPIKEELARYLEIGDSNNYCVKIHGFKNNAYTVGAMILGDMAYEMERISKEGLPEEIKVLQKHLFEQYDVICRQFCLFDE